MLEYFDVFVIMLRCKEVPCQRCFSTDSGPNSRITRRKFVQPVWSIAASKLEAVKSTSEDKNFFKQKMLDDFFAIKTLKLL